MESFTNFLTELQANGTARGAHIKPPQALLDFLVEQVETQTAKLGGHPVHQDITDLVTRIMRKAKPCYPSLVVAMFYLDKLWQQLSLKKSATSQFGQSGLPEVLAAFILADKYIYDVALANCEWAKVSGIHALPQVNGFEREFFAVLGYSIQFTEDTFRDFVSFLDISLTIRQHQLQATSDFPLTFSHLCQLQHQQQLEEQQKAEEVENNNKEALQETTLITLRVMMVYCLTFYSSLVTSLHQQAKVVVASSTSSPLLTRITRAKTLTPEEPLPLPKPFKQAKLIKSDSWSGSTDTLVLKPRGGRKFSDAMIGQQAPWYLSLMGKIRS